jgi:hypothetical protein
MRAGNILTSIAALLWGAFAVLGHELTRGAFDRYVPGFPNFVQIDYYLVFPLAVLVVLLLVAWVCNATGRWPWLLRLIGVVAIVGLLPYFIPYTGGV